jgi:hypothetical protein
MNRTLTVVICGLILVALYLLLIVPDPGGFRLPQ